MVPPQVLDPANAELDKSGVPLDLKQLKPEQLEALVDHLDETIVGMDARRALAHLLRIDGPSTI